MKIQCFLHARILHNYTICDSVINSKSNGEIDNYFQLPNKPNFKQFRFLFKTIKLSFELLVEFRVMFIPNHLVPCCSPSAARFLLYISTNITFGFAKISPKFVQLFPENYRANNFPILILFRREFPRQTQKKPECEVQRDNVAVEIKCQNLFSS